MQYKIPIQIENEDSIIFWLSLRQLGIIIVGMIIAYGVFGKLENSGLSPTLILILCGCIVAVFVFIAKFKNHEMWFLAFLLNFARWKVNGNGPNGQGRYWLKGTDSYSMLKIGYVRSNKKKEEMKSNHLTNDQASSIMDNISKL